MNKLITTILLIFLMTLFAGCSLYEDFDKDTLIKMTDPIMNSTMEGLNENNYQKFTEHFTDSYKNSFRENSFFEFTNNFYQNPGKYVSRQLYDIRPINDGYIVHYKGIFEQKDNVAITVTFEIVNGEYKIKKLRFI